MSKTLPLTFTDTYSNSELYGFFCDVVSALLSAFVGGHWAEMDVKHRYMDSQQEFHWERDEDKLAWNKLVQCFLTGTTDSYLPA